MNDERSTVKIEVSDAGGENPTMKPSSLASLGETAKRMAPREAPQKTNLPTSFTKQSEPNKEDSVSKVSNRSPDSPGAPKRNGDERRRFVGLGACDEDSWDVSFCAAEALCGAAAAWDGGVHEGCLEVPWEDLELSKIAGYVALGSLLRSLFL